MPLYAAHKGYVFQDLAAACFLIEALVYKYDQITIDRKISSPDDFDDLSIKFGETWIRRQFKHSTSHIFSAIDLQLNGKIELHRLIKSHVLNPNRIDSLYQLCLAWEIPESIDDIDILISCEPSHTLSSLQINAYTLDAQKIWPEGQSPIWSELTCTDYTRDDFIDLCSRLTIQLNWPKASLDLQSPGELEEVLSYLLSNRVGIGRYPNENRNILDVSSSTIRLANLCRSQGKTLSSNEIEHQLEIRTDYGKIAQKFPIDNSIYIYRKDVHEEIKKHVASNQVSIVTGPPA